MNVFRARAGSGRFGDLVKHAESQKRPGRLLSAGPGVCFWIWQSPRPGRGSTGAGGLLGGWGQPGGALWPRNSSEAPTCM